MKKSLISSFTEQLFYRLSFKYGMGYFTKVEVLRIRLDDYVKCSTPQRRYVIALAVNQIFRWSNQMTHSKIIKALGLDYQILMIHSLMFLSDNFFSSYGYDIGIQKTDKGAVKYARSLELLLCRFQEVISLKPAFKMVEKNEFNRVITSAFDAKSSLLLMEAWDKFHNIINVEKIITGNFDMNKMTKKWLINLLSSCQRYFSYISCYDEKIVK